MRIQLVVVLAAACSSKSAPPRAPSPDNTAASNTNTDGPSQHASAFLGKVLDASTAAGTDCDKLASSLESIAPDAKALRAELVAAHQKFVDLALDPALVQRAKAGEIKNVVMACDKEGSPAGKAIDATLRVVDPVDEYDSGNGVVRGTASFGQGK